MHKPVNNLIYPIHPTHRAIVIKKDMFKMTSTCDENQSHHETDYTYYHIKLKCPKNKKTYDTVGTLIHWVQHMFYLFVYHVNY